MDQLKKNKGLIINCSTGQALMGFPNHTGYAASKHAVHGFLESLDIELDGQINIMHVIMGWIRGTGVSASGESRCHSQGFQAVIERGHRGHS